MSDDETHTGAAPADVAASATRRPRKTKAEREAAAAAKAAAAVSEEKGPTVYIVLRRVPIAATGMLDLDPHFPGEMKGSLGEHLWLPVMNGDGKPKEFTGAKAVEQFTGKGEHAKPGHYKQVALRAWKGTEVVEPPVQVYADRRTVLDD